MGKSTLLAAMLSLGLTGTTFGHAKLVSSSPASGAKVTQAPISLTLSFNEEVKLAVLTLTTGGKTMPVTFDKSAPATKTVMIPVSTLAAGAYEIHWAALSTEDGHVTKGVFTFSVLPSAPIP
jgi:methionine-rich copper-binding protein CopC